MPLDSRAGVETSAIAATAATGRPASNRSPAARPALVIGAGLGGLSAAIHLQLAGWRVTVYEANEEAGGRASRLVRDGFRFDIGPSLLNYPWVFEQLFEAAGRRMSDYLTLLPVEPSVSFDWPDGTHLSLSSDLPRLVEELERLEPGSRVGAIAFLTDAAAKYRLAFDSLVTQNDDSFARWMRRVPVRDVRRLSLWRSLDSELQRFFHSRYIREALGSYAMYLGGSPFDLPGFFSILPYGELAYGLWLPQGGIYALVEALVRLAQELGVDIRTGRGVSRIRIEGGAVAGVALVDGTAHDARVVVSGVDVPTTDTELVEPSTATRARATAARQTRMTPSVMTFYWGLRGELGSLPHHTIFLPSDYRGTFDDLFRGHQIPRELAFYLSVASATDRALAPPGCSTVFVLVPMPLVDQIPPTAWSRIRETTRARVIERLRGRGVEWADDRVIVEEVFTPRDWQQRFGLYNGSAFGAAHTLGQVGPLRARNHHADIAGLYYVGAGTTPGTGMPMVVLSGRMVAERVRRLHDPWVN